MEIGSGSENIFGSENIRTAYDLVKMTSHIQNPPVDELLNQMKKMDIDSVNYFIESKENDGSVDESTEKNPFSNPFGKGSIYDSQEESKEGINSLNYTKRLNYAQRSQLVGRLGPC